MDELLLEKSPQLLTATNIGLVEVHCEDNLSDEQTVVLHSNDHARVNLLACKYSPKSVAFRGEHPPSDGDIVTNVESSIAPDQKEDNVLQRANIVDNGENPFIASTKLSSAAAILRTGLHYSQKIAALSIDVPTTAKNTPFITSPATKSITTSPKEPITRTSPINNFEEPPESEKSCEIKGNSFVNKSVYNPLLSKIDATVTFDGEYNEVPKSNPQLNSNSKNAALPRDWPVSEIPDIVSTES